MPFKSELHLLLFTEFYIQPLFPTMPLPLSTQEITTQLYQIYTLPTFPCSIRFWLLHGKPPASWSRRAEQIIQKPFNNLTFSEKNKTSNTRHLFWEHTSSASPTKALQALQTTKSSCAFCVVKEQHEQFFNSRKKSYLVGTQNPTLTCMK